MFQESSPNRFTAELCKYWDSIPDERKAKITSIFLRTDGEPKHRTTFESVKISLIHVFQYTNVDLLVAARMAPGQSFLNPVERVMSVINIALQNVALSRTEGEDEFERTVNKCNSMNDIKKKCSSDMWIDSVEPVWALLGYRIEK